MEERKNAPTFRQETYTKDKIRLDSETHYNLMCDLGTIEEIQECIEYITEEQTTDNDRVMDDNNENYAKYAYARYYMACKTAKYLADYSLTLFKKLEEKFDIATVEAADDGRTNREIN